ncbi:MAG: amidohydrolase/deacetylase family metallohydrolase [Opitutaceae bacterium]
MKRLILAFAACVSLAAQPYDLVLKGGHVIDPRNEIDGVRDVAITAGAITAVAPQIDPADARKIVDVAGLIVAPGLVDIHVHLFATTGLREAWAGDLSVLPDGFSFRTGVTTMVDAGSAGWRNFDTFRHTVIDRAQTRVFALINIAGLGMATRAPEQVKSEFQPDQVALVAAKHRDVVVGVKTAHYKAPDWSSVDQAVAAGELAGLPVMVDFGFFRPERPYWQLVTERLRPGDISTHCFRASVPWLDDGGKVFDYLHAARARGVKFDVGHGAGSFVFRHALPAVRQGFYPDSISSDLHVLSMNIGMMDLPTTLSKFLCMGMPLGEAIRRATWNPAQLIRRTEVGHLSAGASADVAVFRVLEGDFAYTDSHGGRMKGNRRIVCELTVRAGAVVFDLNGRMSTDYQTLGADYGLREGIDVLVPPPKSSVGKPGARDEPYRVAAAAPEPKAAAGLFVATPLTRTGDFTAGIEGPACDASGNVYAVNFQEQGTIGRVTPAGEAAVFVKLPGTSVGNGIRFDREGRMYIADYVNHNIWLVDLSSKEMKVLAHRDGMNQPNDLAITAEGVLYASDPHWREKTGHVWRIGRDGVVALVAEKMSTTNGIEVSPDGKTLYVNESSPRNVWAFTLEEGGSLSGKRLITRFPDFGLDGMRCDGDGNLYVTRTGKGTVVKLSPGGQILQEIDVMGARPTNLCFGGPDGRTVYVTEAEHGRLVQFRVDRPGVEWRRFHPE